MLRFGTSGVPLSSARPTTEHGIRRARELGLDALEMAWVNGVRMSDASADRIREVARAHRISLTAHAPYYVNLCGSPEVTARSIDRLVETARLGERCGAGSFCFHAGFYSGLPPREADARVRAGLTQVMERIRRAGIRIDVRPELTGKPSQLGSFECILDWSRTVAGIRPCIDFAHQHARHAGGFNRYEDFAQMLERVEDRLGRGALDNLHVHVSGIEFGPRGERRHRRLRESGFRWVELLRALKDLRVSGRVVNETPGMEEDAMLLRDTWRSLR